MLSPTQTYVTHTTLCNTFFNPIFYRVVKPTRIWYEGIKNSCIWFFSQICPVFGTHSFSWGLSLYCSFSSLCSCNDFDFEAGVAWLFEHFLVLFFLTLFVTWLSSCFYVVVVFFFTSVLLILVFSCLPFSPPQTNYLYALFTRFLRIGNL